MVFAWRRRDVQEPTVAGSVGSSTQAFAMHCYSLFTPGSLELWGFGQCLSGALGCIAQLGARRREREKEGRARDGGRKKSIETVITNKKHLSHLCNLFSFNIRSMLVEICEF